MNIRLPNGEARELDGPLPETPEVEKALLDDVDESCVANALGKEQHAADHHQIARPIHPEPRGVDCRDLFAPRDAHRGTCRSRAGDARGRSIRSSAARAEIACAFCFALK